ncbi:NADH-ubiquinone oxidoreductase-F iron-sulfur binding region domain-containing protein [Fulvivirgaceae bacterium BMA10]|uniref:NADH-ubiquinone oxidoreductase-F iron-sulfur binding region domain-containing protein n=1 Tax=Splendidivirga corallicola TaxID=3051826 RepID=A0ABT8KW21_9BACT|nr:NADH-ubiquinone oxidoreductase-F iron-sulfur binding region domain-containing protein [Fulvivirgaceae bacterium BMA10]
MSKNLSELSGRKGLKDNLFDRLGQLTIQNQGSPSIEELDKLADEFLIGSANTYGTATFYDFMKPENRGKKVYTCNGSVCSIAGTQDGLKDELKKYFKEEEIGHMCCLGRCHENGAFHYNGKNHSAKTPEEIASIIKEKAKAVEDHYHVKSIGQAVLTNEFPGIDAYYEIFKNTLKRTPENALEEIKKSGIRGRGGAGFPMGFKLESCKNTSGDQKFIVCNADEGDPGAYSDRYLLEKQPHAVLLGMMVAGYVVGANWGVLYIRAEYPESVEIMEQAVQELVNNHLLGDNILGSGFDFNFKVVKAQGAYICGEETALLASLEGQRPEVRVRPPYPTQEGLFNRPTVVNNVETLAAIPFIMQNGGEAYKSIGTSKSSGTKLVCLDSFFNNPGMYEVEMGTPLSVVINDLGGGFKEPVKAMHIGGPLGGLVPSTKIDDLTVDFESFSQNGFLLGHASVVCIPENYPIVKYLEHLFEFTAHESCGKCFPCRLGSTRGSEMLNKAQHEDFKIDRQLFDDLLETLEIGSLCALGGGLPLPVKNALQYFQDELKPYFT